MRVFVMREQKTMPVDRSPTSEQRYIDISGVTASHSRADRFVRHDPTHRDYVEFDLLDYEEDHGNQT